MDDLGVVCSDSFGVGLARSARGGGYTQEVRRRGTTVVRGDRTRERRGESDIDR